MPSSVGRPLDSFAAAVSNPVHIGSVHRATRSAVNPGYAENDPACFKPHHDDFMGFHEVGADERARALGADLSLASGPVVSRMVRQGLVFLWLGPRLSTTSMLLLGDLPICTAILPWHQQFRDCIHAHHSIQLADSVLRNLSLLFMYPSGHGSIRASVQDRSQSELSEAKRATIERRWGMLNENRRVHFVFWKTRVLWSMRKFMHFPLRVKDRA